MKRTTLLGAASLLAVISMPAFAQEAPYSDDDTVDEAQEAPVTGLADIVVTAQRRRESVQDVPIAVSAFDSGELARRGVTNALEVAQYVPNLVGLNNTGLGSANSYYLRGLGNTETIPTFDPPIGTYVDDIYLSRQNANNLSLFDVERIEVLRGPQGTLFGRNTTGGAVSVFLAEPGDTFGGYAEVGYGSYDTKLARASLDIPLAEGFAIKLSGYFQDDDGYAKNTTTGERVNESDGWGARLGIRGEMSDNARWTASYMHIASEAGNILNFDCDPANSSDCDGRFVTTGLSKDTNFNGLLTGEKAGYGLGNRTDMDFISSNFEFGGDDVSVNVITGYVYTTQDYALDFADGRGLPSLANPVPPVFAYTYGGFSIINQGEFSQFSQELKFNAELGDGLVDLVGGVFYFEEDNFSDFADIFSISLPIAPPPTGVPLVLADRTLRNETRAYAGYLQGDLNVTDDLTLTAGIRYTDETKRFSVNDNRARCNTPGTAGCIDDENLVAPNGVAIPQKQTAKIWTPRFAANYQVNGDVLLFASATRGFKSGGWNARGTAASELLPFQPEKAWSYEAGIKSEFLDRRLRVNLTAYYLDVSDLQTPAAFTRDNGSIAFITRNFADYENKGVELEVNALPVDGLNLFASVGYQDDKYKFDSDGGDADLYGVESVLSQQARCLDQLGRGLIPGGDATACGVGIVAPDGSIAEPVRTPDFTVAFGGSYAAEIGDTLTLTPSINASWRADSEVGTAGFSLYDDPIASSSGTVYPSNPYGDGDFIVGSFSEARWIVNATLTLAADSGWSLAAQCQNCFDEEAIESALANYSYLNPPRTWTLRAKYEF